ncbi:MAG: O-antigen ligase family protein [Saprospiraceae bacterium]
MQLSFPRFEDKSDWLLLVFVSFLIILPQVSQGAIALYLIHWIATKQYKFLYKIRSNWFTIGSITYFLFFVISGLYSENTVLWGRDIEAKLPLLIVPILLTSRKKYNPQLVNLLLFAFGLSCFIYVGYLHYETYLGSGQIFRSVIGSKTYMNAIYAAMYISFPLLVGLSFIVKKKPTINYQFILAVLTLLFFHYSLYAIASRMALLALMIVELSAVFLWKIVLNRQIIQGGVLMALVFIINFLSVNFTQYAKKRMESAFKGDPRVEIWKATRNQIPESPIIGFGSGDAQAIMFEAYKKIDFEYGIKQKYNNHSQYFESWISAGIFCLIALLAWLGLVFRDGWLEKNYVLCIFIGMIALNFLTESMLERQQGTYFMAFWGAVLYWNSRKE